MSDEFVPALLEERRGYVVRNLPDRVAEVDAELAKYGVEVGVDVEAEHVDVVETLETTDGAPAKAPAKKPRKK